MRATKTALALTLAFAAANCQAREATVAFVGCPADGQVGPIEPPKRERKELPPGDVPAAAIAYYKGEEAPGAFAPSGWFCRVWYGSAGSTLLVSATPIDTTTLFPPVKVFGPAVEMQVSLAGTSGRFAVASYASRLFPRVLAGFIQRVKDEMVLHDSAVETNRLADDSVTSVTPWLREFMTPAGTSGLGTEETLGPASLPIRGVAMIARDTTEPDMTLLRVRLGARMGELESAVLRLNTRCMQETNGC